MKVSGYLNKRKASLRGAFFMFLLLAACAQSASDQGVVEHVTDGDTVRMQNGDKVRFIGVNAPELGHGKFKDEPFAKQARLLVAREIKGRQVLLKSGDRAKDRYGRVLAQIFTQDGNDVGLQLIQKGLAFVVAVDKGFGYLPDYLKAETKAKVARKGIWGASYFAPIYSEKAMALSKGYRRVIGQVMRVSRSRKNQTFHLKGGLRVLVPLDNWKQYFKGRPHAYVGKIVNVRGWLFSGHDIVGIKVYHPSMLVTQ